jgi:hypothetical protein
MAALSRFISRLDEKGQPFFKLLKALKKFVWYPQVHQQSAQHHTDYIPKVETLL